MYLTKDIVYILLLLTIEHQKHFSTQKKHSTQPTFEIDGTHSGVRITVMKYQRRQLYMYT